MITIKTKKKFDCDVLIVGGGPAGSGLAYHLAASGIKVTVVEAEVFPRDKICGDGVSPLALKEMARMGITDTDRFEKANEIKKVGLYLKNDKVFIDIAKPDYLPFHARIIPRIELDNWIYEAARDVGATFIQGTRVISYEMNTDEVLVNVKDSEKTYQLRTKLIVGADGSNSVIARQLHGRKPKDEFQLLGIRAYYENVSGPLDRVDIFFSEEGFPGIFWMFPKGKTGANIGIAMISKTLPFKPPHVKQLLIDHINTNPDIKARINEGYLEGKIEGWPITFYNKDQKLIDNRLILIGEAAGMINPLSGDGIQYALLSADWAADTIKECVAKDDFSVEKLNEFKKRVNKEVDYDFSLSNLLVQFPRNKTLTKVWMEILKIVIQRAKTDPEYAAVIAGVFEGTYPSYKALKVSFILKTLQQSGVELGNAIEEGIKNPSEAFNSGIKTVENLFKTLLTELKEHPKEHFNWLTNTVLKTLTVAKHVVKNIDFKKKE